MALILAIAILLSSNRRAIKFRVVGAAFALQASIAALVLYTSWGKVALNAASTGVSNLLGIHSAISGESIASLEARFEGAGYGALKGEVADVVVGAIEPIRNRTEDLLSDPAELDRLLAKGAARASEQAEATLALVYDRIGFVKA